MSVNFRDLLHRLGEPVWWMAPLMVPRYERFCPLLLPQDKPFALLVSAFCLGCGARYRIGYVASTPYDLPPLEAPYHEVDGSRCTGRLALTSVDECYELRFGFLWRPYKDREEACQIV